jgi:hypothetical protein
LPPAQIAALTLALTTLYARAGAAGQAGVCRLLRGSSPTSGVAPKQPRDGDGEFDRFFARVRKDDRDCNIEPPASPYAIMRRVHPYRGENSGWKA